MDNTIQIKFNGSLTWQDYRRFVMYHYRLYFIVYYIAMFLIGCSTGILNDLIYPVLIGIIMASIVTPLVYILLFFTTKRNYNKNPLWKVHFNYTASDEGIKVESEKGHIMYSWSDIRVVKETKNIILAYVGNIQALVIPDNYFDDPSMINDFKQLIISNLDKKKVKFK